MIELEVIVEAPIILSASQGGVSIGVLSVNGETGAVVIDASDLNLENVDNTSDADKPVSTAQQNALDLKVDKVTGKELSSNDYTNSEKANLANQSGTNTGDQDLSGYVEKEAGKGLSTEDYTTTEKNKLAASEYGAETNNISDTNANALTGGDFTNLHKHKPGDTVDISLTNIIDFTASADFKTTLTAIVDFGFTNLFENAVAFVRPTGAQVINAFALTDYTFDIKKNSDPDEYIDGKSTICFKVVKLAPAGIIEYFYSNNA